ncbi:hypothetical protein NLI96_g8863 [Meripilus lineatus]|uniref:Uncharacterized protein n=1 Tax=Meripilus lineatus TaxID=2056292 RepID=A0AAD5UWH5_9APHY|nr:hypothetical protein NLI96_g8863 [Physisporinus lineatus]
MGGPAKTNNPGFPFGLFPSALHPYLELSRVRKLTGKAFIFWPFAWGLSMAAYRTGLPLQTYVTDMLRFFCVAYIVHSSCCTINDMFDRDVDAGVERTKDRPLPSGRVSMFAAFIHLLFQYGIGIWFIKSMDETAFFIYPLFKRFTNWPQAYLGFVISFGLIVAWVDTTHSIDPKLLAAMFVASTCWTIQYDTIYACQDREDDVKMGVGSTAVLFGNCVVPFVQVNALIFVAFLIYAGNLNNQGVWYYLVTIGGTTVSLLRQFSMLDVKDASSCANAFKQNAQLGWIVTLGIALDCYFTLQVPLTSSA